MMSVQAHAAILRKIAAQAVMDARATWKRWRESPDERSTRSAFRACVFAALALRQAAGDRPHHTGRVIDPPGDAPQMLEEAERIEAAAAGLKAQLVKLQIPPSRGP